MSWEEFKDITFSSPQTNSPSYAQFTPPAFLSGSVSTLEGEDISGRIIFDIDEMLDIEILEGRENDIEYSVLLRNIKKIVPKNYDYTSLELRNGKTLMLGGMQDVSAKNGGLLIFVKGKKEPRYIGWKNINEIIFN
jgi:hypothetical protein